MTARKWLYFACDALEEMRLLAIGAELSSGQETTAVLLGEGVAPHD